MTDKQSDTPKRWSIDWKEGHAYIVDTGTFVEYTDYEALERELNQVRGLLTKASKYMSHDGWKDPTGTCYCGLEELRMEIAALTIESAGRGDG